LKPRGPGDTGIRVVNVVDLMTLQPESEHPCGLSDIEFDSIFTPVKPIIFCVPRLPVADSPSHLPVAEHGNLHVRGYKEEGTTTTPFDMTVLNDLDRFHLAGDVVDRVNRLGNVAACLSSCCETNWSSIGNTLFSTARTCRRLVTGSGPDAPPESPVSVAGHVGAGLSCVQDHPG
jgi:phosphoketolase